MGRDLWGTRILILVLVGLLLVAFIGSTILTEITPDLEAYSRSPQDLVIYADENIYPGAPLPGQFCNRIPTLRIWGSGRVVYAENDPQTGLRLVYTASLAPDQIGDMLEMLKERGFFEPVEVETPNPSGTYFHLSVYLAPDQQNATVRSDKSYLYDLVDALNISLFQRYTPSRALLITGPSVESTPQPAEWPADLGFSLAEAEQGKWIQGPALEYLWQYVNAWQGPVPALNENGQTYAIALQIPGISASEPPFDCWGSLKSIVTATPPE